MESSALRMAFATMVIVAYVTWCLVGEVRHRRRARAAVAPATRSATTVVAYASQTGFAEEVAHDTAARLARAGVPARALPLAAIGAEPLPHGAPVLFVASTTGEGDAPDTVAEFAATAMARAGSLTGVRYGMLALGDSAYVNYCAFGRALDTWLATSGATPLFARIEVDAADPLALARWDREVAAVAGLDPDTPAASRVWATCTLVSRAHVNAGSPGAPAYALALAVPSALVWEAGDIAVIAVGGEDDAPAREYSIASVQEEGMLLLLVREARHPGGTLGIGSAFLLHDLGLAGDVRLRVRRNRAFHVPDDDVPMILIGNGTGIAGLRALLARRARQGRGRNWLLFGERTRAHDMHFGADLERWVRTGQLARADFAFSRDGSARHYVQDLVSAHGDALRRWVAEGAVIYVCGSEVGMAPAVDATLRGLLGDESLEQLRRVQRYRRDVY